MTAFELEDLCYLRELIGPTGLEGPGDDAACLRLAGDYLVCMDPVVEGKHFRPDTAIDRVARSTNIKTWLRLPIC